MFRRAAAAFLIVLLALGIIVLIVDLVNLGLRLQEYQAVYGFSEREASWSHRSPQNYAIFSLLLSTYCLIGILIAAWNLRSAKALAAKALYVILASLICMVLFNLFQWWQTGFDH